MKKSLVRFFIFELLPLILLYSIIVIDSYIYTSVVILFNIIAFFKMERTISMVVVNMITTALLFGIANGSDLILQSRVKYMIIFFFFIFLISAQTMRIIFFSFSLRIQKPPKSSKKGIRALINGVLLLDIISNIMTVLIAVLYPVILSVVIISSFAIAYSNISVNINSENNRLYYSKPDESKLDIEAIDIKKAFKNPKLLFDSDFFYFSSVTYFTIGYGDITPEGNAVKSLIIMEMIIAHLLGITLFAMYSSLFYERFIKKSKLKELIQ